MSDLSLLYPKAKPEVLAGVDIMLSAVRGIPDHLLQGVALAEGIVNQLQAGITRITLCGLGGSAFPGNLLEVVQHQIHISISTYPAVLVL